MVSRKIKIFFILCIIFVTNCLIILPDFGEHLNFILKEYKRKNQKKLDIVSWLQIKQSFCGGSFSGFGHQFAVLKDVVITPHEEIFYIKCPDLSTLKYHFESGKEGTHLNRWLRNIKSSDARVLSEKEPVRLKQFTVAVKRYEYANLYHTMTDWYNVFLVSKAVNQSLDHVTVLLFDDLAKGYMDDTWKLLFGEVIQLPLLNKEVFVETLAWNILGYESPINYHGLTSLPFIEEFSEVFLRKHRITTVKRLDCQNMTMFFLWRKDYVSHPGNQEGVIKRKFENENEMIRTLQDSFPMAHVRGDNFDRLTFAEQLKIVSSTDILISMHGAGLSHILFMPPHSAVLELFPNYKVKFTGLIHFEAMARWRGIHYSSYQSLNPSNERDNWKTYIPPLVLLYKVRSLYNKMCSERSS